MGDARENCGLAGVEAPGIAAHRHHKATVKLACRFSRERAVKGRVHHRSVVDREKRHRHQPPRPKAQATEQAVGFQMHFAVATKAGGAHRHRLDHGAKAANAGASRINLGQAAAQQRHIGGGAANVADQRIGCPR